MKIRLDYVTNSSSSSFIVAKKYLTENQINGIHRHMFLGQKLGVGYSYDIQDTWDIEENDDFITGHTFLDNFDMYELLKTISVPMDKVIWGEHSFDLDKYKESSNSDDEEETIDFDWEKWLNDEV